MLYSSGCDWRCEFDFWLRSPVNFLVGLKGPVAFQCFLEPSTPHSLALDTMPEQVQGWRAGSLIRVFGRKQAAWAANESWSNARHFLWLSNPWIHFAHVYVPLRFTFPEQPSRPVSWQEKSPKQPSPKETRREYLWKRNFQIVRPEFHPANRSSVLLSVFISSGHWKMPHDQPTQQN